MKNKKLLILFVLLVAVVVSFNFSKIKASSDLNQTTTLTDSDGLDIDVSNITPSQVELEKEYIKNNVNEAYVKKGDTLVTKDIITAKNLFVNKEELTSGNTIDDLWNNTPEAFILESDMVFPLYDIDETSDYYVAFVDTMHYDNESNVEDISFAYTNLNGEVISDAIYDYETGIAYVPKKYTEEDKNGNGANNVQVELLQAVSNNTPKTTFEVKVTTDGNNYGTISKDGLANVELLNVKFGLNLALDDKAKAKVNEKNIKVKINGYESDKWTYYTNAGILVINAMPSTIRTVEIDISQANVEENATISSTYSDATTADMVGQWIVSQTPTAGAEFTIQGEENVNIYYDAWNHGDLVNANSQPDLHLYGPGDASSDEQFKKIFDEILRGNGNIDLNNINENNTWLQYDVSMLQDTTVTASDGTQMVIPQGHWFLKCTHNAETFTTSHDRVTIPNGYHDTTYELRGKVLQVANNYIIVGLISSESHNQSGAGLFKVAITGQTGTLKIAKKDEHGNYIKGAKFRVSGQDIDTEVTTGDDGTATLNDIKIGEYTVEETYVPGTLLIDTEKKTVNVESDKVTTYEANNSYPKGRIRVHKITANGVKSTGDATLEGAEFVVKAAEDIYEGSTLIYSKGNGKTEEKDKVVAKLTTDKNGYTNEATNLPIGKYYLYETKAPEGYKLNENIFDFEVKYIDNQTKDIGLEPLVISDEVVLGGVKVLKFENNDKGTDKSAATGAVLQLTLKSDTSKFYRAEVNDKGEAEFIDEENKALGYEYTIPYGKYSLKEVPDSNGKTKGLFFIQPDDIVIDEQSDKEYKYKIVSDEPIPTNLEVYKVDSKTNKKIKLSDAEFKIWCVEDKNWVISKVYPSGEEIDTYKTGEDGTFTTQAYLYPTKHYRLYEIKAPEGYYLHDEYRLPEDLSKLDKSGIEINLSKESLGLREDQQYPEGGVKIGDIVYKEKVVEKPLLVSLTINKKGEKLDGIKTEDVEYTKQDGTTQSLQKIIPTYKEVGLKGVSYRITAAEEIVDTNGVTHFIKDQVVQEKITTNDEGIATTTVDMWPGKYNVQEIEVPEGYTLDKTIKTVTLENKDQYVEKKNTSIELKDNRQKLKLTFNKYFEDTKYSFGENDRVAVFGVFADEDIKNYNGIDAIHKDDLLDMISVEQKYNPETNKYENVTANSNTDFPAGKYYVKELYTSLPYTVSDKEYPVTMAYSGNDPEVPIKGKDVKNTVEYGKAIFVKISKSSEDNLIINGSFSDDTSKLDKKAKDMINAIRKCVTNEEIAKYYEDNGIICVPGATYEVWLDKDGKNKLTDSQTKEVVQFTTDKVGMIEIDDLPKNRTYYLKEVSAPEGYQVSETPVEFNINNSTSDAILYQAIYDEKTKTKFIHKTDIFTGENVANCTFEITDKDGKVLLHSVTDNDGTAWIPQDIFKNDEKYYYQEISAPDVYYKDGKLYELNTEKHEFTAKIDENGKWETEKIEVQNYRPTTDVKLIKTDEEDNVVPNCKFELKSEENGLYDKTGVTDENGIYVFKNVPQGWYTYTELEAPEKYDLDTTPHRVYVTGDEMVIEFVNTGDIPVIALSIVAVVSVIGIVVLVIKKNKKNNNK